MAQKKPLLIKRQYFTDLVTLPKNDADLCKLREKFCQLVETTCLS